MSSIDHVVGRKWQKKQNPQLDWKTACLHVSRIDGNAYIIQHSGPRQKTVIIQDISNKSMRKLVCKRKTELFTVCVKPTTDCVDVFAQLVDLVDEFRDVFRNNLLNELPPYRVIDFEISLKTDGTLSVRLIIRLSADELSEHKKTLKDLLEKGFIRQSSSPFGAPVYFIRKKEGDLGLVCDYRALNKLTIPDANPVLLLSVAIDQVIGGTVFFRNQSAWSIQPDVNSCRGYT